MASTSSEMSSAAGTRHAHDVARKRRDSQEQLPRGLLLDRVELSEQRLGPPGDCLAHPADAFVCSEVEQRPATSVEQLGERILEQRQRVRLGSDGRD